MEALGFALPVLGSEQFAAAWAQAEAQVIPLM